MGNVKIIENALFNQEQNCKEVILWYEKEINKTLISLSILWWILTYASKLLSTYDWPEFILLFIVFIYIISLVHLIITPRKKNLHIDFTKLFSWHYKPKNYKTYCEHKFARLLEIYNNTLLYHEKTIKKNKTIYILLLLFLILILFFNYIELWNYIKC